MTEQIDHQQSEELNEVIEIDIQQLCRLCGNLNNLIPIFEGDGLKNEIPNKLNKYIPINVSIYNRG